MQAQDILHLFKRVRKSTSRRNSWQCQCPAHQDKGPSLAISETDDGRILMHCFAGCSPDEVCAAAGLKLQDLFPDSRHPNHRAPSSRLSAPDALRCVSFEATVVYLCAAKMANGKPLTDNDRSRLGKAYTNINTALELSGVTR